MIEHVCLYRTKPGIKGGAQRIVKLFREVRPRIPEIMDMSVGINATDEAQYARGYTVGLRMVFDSWESKRRYLDHPEHLKLRDEAMTMIEEAVVCDFEA